MMNKIRPLAILVLSAVLVYLLLTLLT